MENEHDKFQYDSQRDFLTNVSYNNGSTWTGYAYDSAGNRTTNSCTDNSLNEMTSCAAYDYAYDSLGNRTSRTAHSGGAVVTYSWDVLNRLTNYNSLWAYTYRADGMRTKKYKGTINYSNFRYDGQMLMQDEGKASGTAYTTNYGLGARGVDIMEKPPALRP